MAKFTDGVPAITGPLASQPIRDNFATLRHVVNLKPTQQTPTANNSVYVHGGNFLTASGDSTVTVVNNAASAVIFPPILVNPRIDVLVVNDLGTFSRIAGIEAPVPVPPPYPPSVLPLAEVLINEPASVTIVDADIKDIRPMLAIRRGVGVATRKLLPFDMVNFADGVYNNVNTSRVWDPADLVIWNKFEPQAATQHLDIVFAIRLPEDFGGFSATAFEFFSKVVVSATVGLFEVVDSLGVSQLVGFPASSSPLVKTVISVPAVALTGSFLPSTEIYLRIRAEGDLASSVFVSNLAANILVT